MHVPLPRFIYAAASVLLFITIATPLGGEQLPMAGTLNGTDVLRLGERMYREGILPSGRPMDAVVAGDIPVSGTMFSCISCHLRSGLGSYEGSVYSPPVNGRRLFLAFGDVKEPVTRDDLLMIPFWIRPTIRRVAYTDATLGEAIREGKDASGREMNAAMPRYLLDDADLRILIAYLKRLSYELSPGVTDTTIRFATVMTDDVSPGDREVVLAALRGVVHAYNTRPDLVKRLQLQSARKRTSGAVPQSGEKDRTHRNMSLDVWELKGDPLSWKAQLEAYYSRKPVFALMGGMSTRDWRPVHEFCEQNKIPCLLPLTDLPVVSETDWYTVYLSKGLYQEGEAAARYLAADGERAAAHRVVQVHRDTPEGRALAAGFRTSWQQFGHQPPVDELLTGSEHQDGRFWSELMKRHQPDVVLYWETAEGLPRLASLAESGGRLPAVFVSYGLLKEKIYSLPESARPFTLITYPYDANIDKPVFQSMSQPWYRDSKTPLSDIWFFEIRIPPEKKEIVTRAATVNTILNEVFMRFDRYYYRDYLLDVVGMMPDLDSTIPLYPRVSFGPGQRYSAKGCYIMKLGPGPEPGLLRESEWIVN